LAEASFAIVRILQEFPKIEAGSFERPQTQQWQAHSSHHNRGVERKAMERQMMTLVMSAADGCPVSLWREGPTEIISSTE